MLHRCSGAKGQVLQTSAVVNLLKRKLDTLGEVAAVQPKGADDLNLVRSGAAIGPSGHQAIRAVLEKA